MGHWTPAQANHLNRNEYQKGWTEGQEAARAGLPCLPRKDTHSFSTGFKSAYRSEMLAIDMEQHPEKYFGNEDEQE